MVDLFLLCLGPWGVELGPVGVQGELVVDGFLAPRGAADDHGAVGGRHHGGEYVLEDGFVVVEEGCLVADDKVGGVASEEVFAVGEGDYLASVSELDGCAESTSDEFGSFLLGYSVDEAVDLVSEYHALAEPGCYYECQLVWVEAAVPE